MVNGHKSAANTDSPDGSTGQTCLAGGMHCTVLRGCMRVWSENRLCLG